MINRGRYRNICLYLSCLEENPHQKCMFSPNSFLRVVPTLDTLLKSGDLQKWLPILFTKILQHERNYHIPMLKNNEEGNSENNKEKSHQ